MEAKIFFARGDAALIVSEKLHTQAKIYISNTARKMRHCGLPHKMVNTFAGLRWLLSKLAHKEIARKDKAEFKAYLAGEPVLDSAAQRFTAVIVSDNSLLMAYRLEKYCGMPAGVYHDATYSLMTDPRQGIIFIGGCVSTSRD